MSDKQKNLTINDYFEMYLNNRIKYDRQYHINNMSRYNFTVINKKLIQQIFTYIDQVIFGGKLTDYVTENQIDFQFKVPKSMTSTAGFFFWKQKIIDGKKQNLIMGFKISHNFFQNIVDKKIINMDLGVLDDKDKKYLSTNTIEPLLTTMEHEIIHMLMYVTRDNKLNDLHTMKSGHTRVFKRLVYNIFGHHKITHNFSMGDATVNQAIKDTIDIGSYVRDTKTNVEGYVVSMKEKSVVICHIDSTEKIGGRSKTKYTGAFYKDIEIKQNPTNWIDVKDMMERLQPGISVRMDGLVIKILQVNNVTIKGQTPDNKLWKVPKFRILDMVFM